MIALIGLAFVPTYDLGAQGASTTVAINSLGILTGTMTNAATDRTLEGARVVLQGTNPVVLTF